MHCFVLTKCHTCPATEPKHVITNRLGTAHNSKFGSAGLTPLPPTAATRFSVTQRSLDRVQKAGLLASVSLEPDSAGKNGAPYVGTGRACS